MTLLPHTDRDAELRALAERAMQHAATAVSGMTGCRRRACRRNGCCGPMEEGGCLNLPGGLRVEPVRLPPCIVGADPQIVAQVELCSRVYLLLLLCDPGYGLHSARSRRTFGETPGSAEDEAMLENLVARFASREQGPTGQEGQPSYGRLCQKPSKP